MSSSDPCCLAAPPPFKDQGQPAGTTVRTPPPPFKDQEQLFVRRHLPSKTRNNCSYAATSLQRPEAASRNNCSYAGATLRPVVSPARALPCLRVPFFPVTFSHSDGHFPFADILLPFRRKMLAGTIPWVMVWSTEVPIAGFLWLSRTGEGKHQSGKEDVSTRHHLS